MPRPPNGTSINEWGTRRKVLRAMYCAVFFSPTTTGSIGIPAFEYSPTALIASAQKCLGVKITVQGSRPSRRESSCDNYRNEPHNIDGGGCNEESHQRCKVQQENYLRLR